MFRVLCLCALLATTSHGQTINSPARLTRTDSTGALCSPCVQLGQQGIQILVNYLLQVGVVGSCGKLCSKLSTKAEQVACDLVCDVVGIKAFMNALNHTDLDPIYFCEELHACPAGPDDAVATITGLKATPSTVAKGDEVTLECDLDVANATGVGEFRIAVDGPVTQPVGQGFALYNGIPTGQQTLSVKLKIKDDDSGDFPVVWSPGNYTFKFEVCQGECGSKHPHSKVFGKAAGSFSVTMQGKPSLIV